MGGAINLTSEDILAQIFSKDERNVIYSSECFYLFDNRLWRVDNEGVDVMRLIKNKLKPDMNKIVEALGKDIKALNTVNKSHRILETHKGLTNILARAKDLLKDEEFSSKLDTNVRLIPFDNGVYDIKTREFRECKREDLISKTVGYTYDEFIRKEEVWKMIVDILPQEDVRDYFLKCCANALDGGIPNTNIVLMIGESAYNGKTCLMGLLQHTMGFLGETVNPAVLTQKENNAGAPSPHLAKLQNVRLVCMSEPERSGFQHVCSQASIRRRKDFIRGCLGKTRSLSRCWRKGSSHATIRQR